jgi:hypothetical protein
VNFKNPKLKGKFQINLLNEIKKPLAEFTLATCISGFFSIKTYIFNDFRSQFTIYGNETL